MRAAIFVAAICLALIGQPALAQKKGHKEAEKFRSQTDATRKSVEQSRDQLDKTMDHYNAMFQAEKPKKLSSAYGNLSKSLDACEKNVKGVQKNVDAMKKQADKFFASWEQEIETLSNAPIQEKSRGRLETARGRYDGMLASMREAKELYDPFILSLREQVMFLGRDLHPASIADLTDEAEQMNRDAEVLFAKIEEILTGGREAEEEFDAVVAEDEAEIAEDETGSAEGEEPEPDDSP